MYIELNKQDRVATLTINRPEKRNAVDYHGWIELQRIATAVANDLEVRVVVITGTGEEAFSAGADIKDFDKYRSNSSTAKTYAKAFEGALDAVESIPKPTISLIKGYCIGGGCELSMATDIRLAADNSRFGIPVAKLSILIGYSEMRRLVNLVGPGNANYILMTAKHIDSSEALRIGLVNYVIPLSEIDTYTYTLAREMVPLAPLSQKRHKEILETILSNPSLTGLSPVEKHRPFSNFETDDYMEGRQAFLERRSPRFFGK